MSLKKNLTYYFISLVLNFVILIIIIWILFLVNDLSTSEFLDSLPKLFFQLIQAPLFWIILSTPFIIIQLIKFWIRGYKAGGLKLLGRRFSYSFVAPSLFVFFLAKFSFWYKASEDFDYRRDEHAFNTEGFSQKYFRFDNKIRGIHVFGERGLDSLELRKLTRGNIEYIILVPYAYQSDYDTPELEGPFGNRVAKRRSTYESVVQQSRKFGIEVIIKPHVWINNPSSGKWRSDIWMDNEDSWKIWEEKYESFILEYAKMSERFNLPLFCIGNEFYLSTSKRPEFWKSLIKKVREVYSGKLTYGANWDREFKEIIFWDQLDFIGVQAYFPLASETYPTLAHVRNGWDKYLEKISTLAKKVNKQVIFTELGYKSTPDAAKYPWSWENPMEDLFQPVSNRTQVYCYQAFFDKVWVNDWFAGVMIWQWHTRGEGEPINHNFTPKGKPAFNEIAKGFKLKNHE